MSKLFKLNDKKLFEKIETKKFKKEKEELRDLFRRNLENNFFSDLIFLSIEYYIPAEKKTISRKKGENSKKRNFVDTICYYENEKEKTFVLIEYKNNSA